MELENYYRKLEEELSKLRIFFVRRPNSDNNYILIRSSLANRDLGIITLLNNEEGDYSESEGFCRTGKELCSFKMLAPGTKINTSFESEALGTNKLILFLYLRDSFGMEYNSELDCLEKVVYLSNIEVLPLDKFMGITLTRVRITEDDSIRLNYTYAVGILTKYGYDRMYNQTKPKCYYMSSNGNNFDVALPWSDEVLEFFLDNYERSVAGDINTGAGEFEKKTIVRKTRM